MDGTLFSCFCLPHSIPAHQDSLQRYLHSKFSRVKFIRSKSTRKEVTIAFPYLSKGGFMLPLVHAGWVPVLSDGRLSRSVPCFEGLLFSSAVTTSHWVRLLPSIYSYILHIKKEIQQLYNTAGVLYADDVGLNTQHVCSGPGFTRKFASSLGITALTVINWWLQLWTTTSPQSSASPLAEASWTYVFRYGHSRIGSKLNQAAWQRNLRVNMKLWITPRDLTGHHVKTFQFMFVKSITAIVLIIVLSIWLQIQRYIWVLCY